MYDPLGAMLTEMFEVRCTDVSLGCQPAALPAAGRNPSTPGGATVAGAM